MRLMLGRDNQPNLLVNVKEDYTPECFDFWVVNGAWEGTYTNGYITIKGCPTGDFSSLDKMEVLTDNQDRLRSNNGFGEYEAVFSNFNNPDYVAPKQNKFVEPESWDDDVAF